METCDQGETKQTSVYVVPHAIALQSLRMDLDTELRNCGYISKASEDGATFYSMPHHIQENEMPILIYEGTITGHATDDEDESTTYPALRVVLADDAPYYEELEDIIQDTLQNHLENPDVLLKPTEEKGGISYTIIAQPEETTRKYVSSGLSDLALQHKLRHIIE
ncbi:hypothetical protein HZC21_04885 [Candidatus Peregrinibacteria bacterium]|nr:hypothetical protein [Candidatus Peregrinibacteria bacterium]